MPKQICSLKWVLVATLASAIGPVSAAPAPGLQTPSGGIHCLYDAAEGGLRCEVAGATNPQPAAPEDCPVDYGPHFFLPVKGKATRICVGDTVADPANPVLPYGERRAFGQIVCESSTAGLQCKNSAGSGFRLKRSEQTLF